MSTTLYIDGQWVPAQQGGTRTITCPADGTEVAVVAEATREDTVTATYEESSRILDEIGALGVSYQEVVEQLETEGLQKFDASWDELLATVRTALDDAR